jgi:hypothetical protein
MKIIYLQFLIVFAPICIWSQFDTKNKKSSFSAPISTSKLPALPSEKFKFEPKPTYSDKFPNPNHSVVKNDILVTKTNTFANPNDIVKDRLNAEKGNFLGDFKTKSSYVRIVCRDFGEFDGDKVSVYLNDELINGEVLLESSSKQVVINLSKGFNKIQFQALNEGYSSPNTAEFEMFDDKGNVITSNQWNLFTGDRATINVTR